MEGKSLYERIRETESHIDTLRKEAAHLQQSGLEVSGNYPILKEEAQRLLRNDEYIDNSLVQEMRSGRRLQDIVNGIIDEREFSLKFPWRKRERVRYNERAHVLDRIIPKGFMLKRTSILIPDLDSPITYPIMVGSLFSGVTKGIMSLGGEQSNYLAIGLGLFAFLFGLSTYGINYSTNRKLRKDTDLYDQIQYIDRILEVV